MKSILWKSLASVIFLTSLFGCSSLGLREAFFKSSSFKPYEEKTLKNGLRIIAIKDRNLPRFSMGMMVFSGTVHDPKGKEGVSALTAQLLSKGTQNKNALEMADAFGRLGTSFSQQVGKEYAYFSSSSLSCHKEQLFDLFYETLMSPALSKSEMKRLKKRMISRIGKRSDDPSSFTSASFVRYLYGEHPYGNLAYGSEKSVSSLKKKDVTKHYLRYYRPNNVVMYIAGDFSQNFFNEIAKQMENWEAREIPPLTLPLLKPTKGLKIRLVHKKGLQQAQIRLGHLSLKREKKEYFSLRMASAILGGGFSSRLNQRIRDDLGLTYSVYSSLNAHKQSGYMKISTFTRNEKVKQTLRESLEIYKKMSEEGIKSTELKDNKALMAGKFPRLVETADLLAFNLLRLRLYGIDDDYLHGYLGYVSGLGLSQMNQVVKKYFHPKDIKVVVYADSAKVLKQLKELGEVEVVSYENALEVPK